jgi:hypothetical protein
MKERLLPCNRVTQIGPAPGRHAILGLFSVEKKAGLRPIEKVQEQQPKKTIGKKLSEKKF